MGTEQKLKKTTGKDRLLLYPVVLLFGLQDVSDLS